jgi:hypothetical protein
VARGFSEGGHVFEVGEQPGLFVDGVYDESVGAAVGAVEEAAVGVDLDSDGAGAFGSGLRGHVSTSHWLGSGGSAGGPGVSELPAGWRGIDANWKLRPDPVGGSQGLRTSFFFPVRSDYECFDGTVDHEDGLVGQLAGRKLNLRVGRSSIEV